MLASLVALGLLGMVAITGVHLFLRDHSGEAAHKQGYESGSIYVYDLSAHKQIMALNADQRREPASLTKMATTLVALGHMSDLSARAPVDLASYRRAVENNASMAGFVAGETTTFRDLLYGTMLASGGEAAGSLAVDAVGSVQACVDEMNALARRLKMTNTH